MIAQLNDIAQIWWQWMGSMFWQVSLLIILVSALDMVIRKWAWPQVRYALWVLVFIKLIIPPSWEMPTSIVSWIQPQVEEQISVQIGISDEAVDGGEILLLQSQGKAVAEQVTWKTWLLSGWVSGMIIFTLLLFRKMIQFRKWRRIQSQGNIPEWHNELIVKVAKKLKLKKIPTIVFSKDVKSPAVYGFTKPYLILPEGFMDKLSKEQTEHVLIHELCHIKRGDLLVHWLCILIQIVYWFNPLLIWSRRQMRCICEICCDLSVANILREKTVAYRETLLKTARELFTENMEPSLGFLGIFEGPFKLVPRLKWLEKKSWENRKRRIATTICTSVFMVICIMPMAGISQTSDYRYEEINAKEVQDKTELAQDQDMIYYEMLIMEADKEREFDFGSTPGQQPVVGMTFHNFNDGLNIDGELFQNIGELIRFLKDDSDVEILSTSPIMARNGSTAKLSVTDNVPFIAKIENGEAVTDDTKYVFKDIGVIIKITPETINENNFITQALELEINRLNEEDPSTTIEKAINTKLVIKDGHTFLITLKAAEDANISEDNSKNLYVFMAPHIIRKPSTGDEDTVIYNSEEDPPLVTMDFKNTDIKLFIKFISELTGKNFIVGKDIKGKVTIVAPTKLTVDEAYEVFESVLDVNGFTTEASGAAIKIVKKE